MSREKGGYEQELAKQIASAFVQEARKQGVTTIREIL